MTSNLYSFYNWGGWLIWNYPGVKPLIDGRMHMWRDSGGFSAFEEYSLYETLVKSLDDSPFDVVYRPVEPDPVHEKMAGFVAQGGWRVAYVDDYAVIYTRVDPQ